MEKINIENVESEKTIDYKNHLVTTENINNRLKDYITGKIKKGYGIKIPLLDDVIVCKTKEMFACVGKKGRGKTTIQEIFFLMWAMVNDVVFVLCLQENDSALAKKDLLGYLLGCNPKDVYNSNKDLYNKAVAWLDSHFYFLRDIDSFKEATEVTEQMVKDGVNVQALFLDPANTFDSGWFDSGTWQDEKKTAKKVLKFAKSVCSVFLSQHPTMSAQRSQEDVNSYNAEGGHLLNKADFTWHINRDNGSNVNRIGVDNVRNKYTGGDVTHPDSPLLLYWGKYNIGIGYENQKEEDIIQKIRKRFNPLAEDFKEELKEKETLPTMNVSDAFGTDEDIPF